jgi:hypothetical protein
MLGKLLLPIRTKRAVKNGVVHRSPDYSDAVQIGIIFKYQDDRHYEQVLNFVRQLKIDKKEVNLLAFMPPQKDLSVYRFSQFTAANLSVWGKLTSEEIDVFLARQYDFLIDLDIEPSLFVDNILSRANAKCKIGHFNMERKDFYQMMIHIDPSNDFEIFLDKVYFYIKKLRADA